MCVCVCVSVCLACMCVHIFSTRDPEQRIGALYVASESVLLLRPIVENAEY